MILEIAWAGTCPVYLRRQQLSQAVACVQACLPMFIYTSLHLRSDLTYTHSMNAGTACMYVLMCVFMHACIQMDIYIYIYDLVVRTNIHIEIDI